VIFLKNRVRFCPPPPPRTEHLLCNLLLFLFALSFAHAQGDYAQRKKDTLAILPFTGAQGEDGETIAELFSFQKDLTAVFYPVPRTSIAYAIRNEQGFQMSSGMTDPDTIAALGKQLGATYVVAGTITKLDNQNLLIIAILHTESLRQIAGDIETYRTIEEIDGKLPAMARNIAAAVKKDTSRLPLLALPPVQLAGGADGREADALAQILAAYLIRSGKYAVYPRTKSLEQVQEEYSNQFSGDTADEYLPNVGRAANPRLVLSVTARRLGNRNMFNAAVINLETGIQEAGDTVNYQSLNDGMKAMEDLALKLTDPEKAAAAEAARAKAERERLAAEAKARAEQEAAAKARAEQERLAAEAKARAERERLAAEARARAEQEAAAKARVEQERLAAEAKAKAERERLAAEAKAEAERRLRNATVATETAFREATSAINADRAGGTYTITLTGSFTSNPVTFTGSGSANKTITIKGDRSLCTISNNGGNSLFSIREGVTLVLDNNVTLNGNGKDWCIVYINGGEFVMKTGSTVRGANYSGVVIGNGNFIMQGGEISGNTRKEDHGNGVFFPGTGGGGGVYVGNGTFTMTGGTISRNNVKIGSSIYDSGGGGGVFVSRNGSFTMQGGEISKNRKEGENRNLLYLTGGGGVLVLGTFTMKGGTISNNTAQNDKCGGVYVNGTFTMSGGTISGNTASGSSGFHSSGDGGGVYVNASGTFTLESGIISNNTSKSDGGGGVFVLGTFTMKGGTISGNGADDGGGVYVLNGTFTMSGGTISGNIADDSCGGVFVDEDEGIFIKSGGGIIDMTNVANRANYVVGVYKSKSAFTSSMSKYRKTTAGPSINLDSRVSGSRGGWE
jgi:parallel beta-helix repeat protein